MTLTVGMLLISSFLCSLVAGFVFTYSIVVMPGLSKLDDKDFIKAFQVTDGIIQNNQPLFMITWVGSIVSVALTMVTAFAVIEGSLQAFTFAIGAVYFLGVQGITIFVHLPLNSHLQSLNIEEIPPGFLREERLTFETRWNTFNHIRTGLACAVSASFMLALTMAIG